MAIAQSPPTSSAHTSILHELRAPFWALLSKLLVLLPTWISPRSSGLIVQPRPETAPPRPDSAHILVQSRIRSPTELLPTTYNAWYNDVHIPDILALPEVESAFRYVIANANAADDDDAKDGEGFPYLAVYPRLSGEWLRSETCGFMRVPLHSEMLPGPTGFVLDSIDFGMGGYEVLGSRRDGRGVEGAPKHLVVVPLEEETVKGKGHEELLSESYRSLGLKELDGLSTLLQWDYSPAGTRPGKSEGGNGGLFTGEEYLVIHQLEKAPTDVSEQWGKKPVVYTLIGGFGDVSRVVE